MNWPPSLALAMSLPLVAGCYAAPCRSDPPPAVPHAQASPWAVEDQITLLRHLDEADPAQHEQLYARASHDFETQPTPQNKLSLALVLSVPDRPHSDLPYARQLFADVAASSDAPPAAVQELVRLHFADVDRQQQWATRFTDAASKERVLRKELEQAQAKIDALTDIERTLDKPAARTKGR